MVATPNASTGQNLFIGVDALSTNNIWAVGRADHSPQQLGLANADPMEWDQLVDRAEPEPRPNQNLLTDIDGASAPGTSAVWAVGHRYDPNLAQLRTSATRTSNG